MSNHSWTVEPHRLGNMLVATCACGYQHTGGSQPHQIDRHMRAHRRAALAHEAKTSGSDPASGPIVDIADVIEGVCVIPITDLRDGDELFDVLGHTLGPARLVKTLADGTVRYKIPADTEYRYLDPSRADGTITVKRPTQTETAPTATAARTGRNARQTPAPPPPVSGPAVSL